MLTSDTYPTTGLDLPETPILKNHPPSAFGGGSLILPAILDEAAFQAGANGIILIRYDPSRSDLIVEEGRLNWAALKGSHLRPLGNIIHLVSSVGQLELDSLSNQVFPATLRASAPVSSILAYVPLFANGFNLGSLWVNLSKELSASELAQLCAMGEVAAEAIFHLGQDNQTATTPLEIIQELVKVLKAWEPATYQNSVRQVTWARSTARRLGLADEYIQAAGWAALLHDVGYLGISKVCLQKSGKLSPEEWRIIKRHPITGSRMLPDHPELAPVISGILSHHERYDGNGYPLGLAGKNIPVIGRIVNVVDAYAAMTSERSYRKLLQHEEAVTEILTCSGTQFDPEVTRSFLDCFT